MKADGQFKECKEANGGSASNDEHNRVIEAIEEGLLQVHYIASNTKQPRIIRLVGENCNGFNNKIRGNNKIAKALASKKELNIDCLMYCEHWPNFQHKDNMNDIKQMFQRELACTAIFLHNAHEEKHARKVQEGGTSTICFGDIMGYTKKVCCNEEGLGQWSWILLGGANWHNTKIITRYNSCKNKNINSGTSYQQQHCYFIMKKKELTCPLILFCKHLVNK
jgi:hypothetical protein